MTKGRLSLELFKRHWELDDLDLPEQIDQPGLAPDAFDEAGEQSSLDIIGRYHTFVVVHLLDRAAAASILPEDCDLSPVPGLDRNRHPVMYSFGIHRGVRPRGFRLWSYDYAETIVGLPHVVVRKDGNDTGPRFLMTAVRLNNRLANSIGLAMGLPKSLADFVITADTYTMSQDGSPIVSARLRLSGPQFDHSLPNFATIAPLMQQPVTSRSAGVRWKTPFHIDVLGARMRPMTAEFNVHDDSLPGMPRGEYRFDGLDRTPFDGGYYSVHDWRMSRPEPERH